MFNQLPFNRGPFNRQHTIFEPVLIFIKTRLSFIMNLFTRLVSPQGGDIIMRADKRKSGRLVVRK